MKNGMRGLIVLLLIQGLFFSRAFAAEFLTKAQKTLILREIDSICGDTWCEGDFNFKFNSIRCDAHSQRCNIHFELIESNGSRPQLIKVSETAQFVSKVSNSHPASCTIKNLRKVEDIITSIRPGDGELNDAFYSALTDCISTLETKI